MNKLYVFAISHFCEKARWALDYLGVDYDIKFLAPGAHRSWAKKNALPASSLPVVDTGNELVQGSDRIIDWAESVCTNGKTLTPSAYREELLAIEKRLDDQSGVHIRRLFYSHTLLNDHKRIRENFTRDLSSGEAFKLKLIWPVVRKIMIKAMDIGEAQGRESQTVIDKELAWMNATYSDHRRFLVGDSFTRADLTAAALYARFALPEQHPYVKFMSTPPALTDFVEEWRDQLVVQRILENYQSFR